MCTVHSFPHNIDHCLTFARSEFEGLLEKSPSEANAFLSDPAKYLTAVRQVSTCILLPGQHACTSILFCVVQRWPFLPSIEPERRRNIFLGLRHCLDPLHGL